VNYFPRQLLTADDMFADQDYFRLKLRRHNRFMHGWGTVCGLAVTAAPSSNTPWLVQISAGYALGPYGDEIFVGDSVDLDLSTCGPSTVTNPCDPGSMFGAGNGLNIGSVVYIAIEYSECMARPVSVTPSGCGCDQTTCQNSRIRDSFQIQCLASLPPSYQVSQPTATMCDYVNRQEVPDCPPCPSSPWVVLAAVSLPASFSTQIADGSIDNFTFRRQIFSTAVLQDQVEECCCAPSPTPTPTPTPTPPPPPPTTVTTINFTPGQQFIDTAPQFIKVTFSQPVLRSSITAGTLFVTPQGLANSTGAITFDDNSASQITLSATFTPDANSSFINNSTSYTVTVVGNPPTAVTDINNLPLDGDANAQPGGNYTAIFSVAVIIQ
jgi:hypothetical protein